MKMQSDKVLVMQREYAVVGRGTLVGSDDATSCVIVAVLAGEKAFLAHVDSHKQAPQVAELLKTHLTGEMAAWCVGGMLEQGAATMEALKRELATVLGLVVRACMPGRGCRVRAGGESSFEVMDDWGDEERGPLLAERGSVWLLCKDKSLNCCHRDGKWCPGYRVVLPTEEERSGYARLAQAPDEELLRFCSTTPELEGPRFVAATREVLRYCAALTDDAGMFHC